MGGSGGVPNSFGALGNLLGQFPAAGPSMGGGSFQPWDMGMFSQAQGGPPPMQTAPMAPMQQSMPQGVLGAIAGPPKQPRQAMQGDFRRYGSR